MRKPLQFTLVAGLSALLLVLVTGAFEPQGEQIARGFFRLTQHGPSVKVKSTADCRVSIWARNTGRVDGGVQVVTPPSQFLTEVDGSPNGMVLDVPAATGIDLGSIGAKANEVITISRAYGGGVAVFVTVSTSGFATITME